MLERGLKADFYIFAAGFRYFDKLQFFIAAFESPNFFYKYIKLFACNIFPDFSEKFCGYPCGYSVQKQKRRYTDFNAFLFPVFFTVIFIVLFHKDANYVSVRIINLKQVSGYSAFD